MKDKYEFDESEIQRIPDKTVIMELSGKDYGGTPQMVFSLLLFSGIFGVINYSLVNLYSINISLSACIASFISSFLYGLWKKQIKDEEIVIFFFLAVLGGSGEVHLKFLLDGVLYILTYIIYCILGIVTGVKIGQSIRRKEARGVFKSKLMVIIFSLFLNYFFIMAVAIIINNSVFKAILYYSVYVFIGFFTSLSLNKISNICLFFIFIFGPQMYLILKSAFIDFDFISWAMILIILFSLYMGAVVAKGIIKFKTKNKKVN